MYSKVNLDFKFLSNKLNIETCFVSSKLLTHVTLKFVKEMLKPYITEFEIKFTIL